jgi:2-polyprenyl-3-methyl-5-hydroxy-6-metoxy-1,4-benzoquinol methylase
MDLFSGNGKDKLPGKLLNLQYQYYLSSESREIENFEEGVQKNDHSSSSLQLSIPLYVDMKAGIGGDIWPSTSLFCHLLTQSYEYNQKFRLLFSQKQKILELGSGNGLISILIEKIFPDTTVEITISDIEDHIPLIRYNTYDLNKCEKCKVEEINWLHYIRKDPIRDVNQKKYDVIIAMEW